MNNLHADAFPERFEGYYQGNFVEFRVLDSIRDSYEYEDLTRGYGEGAFYAGALTIGEDGEVYYNFGYEVIAEGPVDVINEGTDNEKEVPGYGPLYLWLERTGGVVGIGSTANSRATALCVEIADDSNTVPDGRTCSMDGSAGHAVQRITARFNDVPRSHDGESEFTFRLAFVKDVGISPESLREDALTATGGAVTRVQRVDDRSDLFEVTAEPGSDDDVTITLPAGVECDVPGAVCTQGEAPEQLYNSPTATVAGPILTASFQGLPSQHDGETAFSFRIAFSDEIATDEAEFRDHSVEVWGGEVTRAEPVGQRRDLWEVEVEPASDDMVMISLKLTQSCAATGAVCTAGGRLLSVFPGATVPGPATWPVQITGEAQVGKTLTADSSNLSERYGVQVTSMTYRRLANGARVPGANSRTYKPGDDKQGKKISVMATYTDDRGNEETVTSGPTEPLAARDRIRRATGLPLISGRALVGHTLTADKSLIIDANGLENAVFHYFWEADDESIPGATGTTYTPVAADVGKEITVIVAWVDDASHGQNMTSQPTMPVMTEEAAAAVEFRTSMRAAANADGSLTLYWNAPDDDVTSYRILRHRHSLGELDLLVYLADTGSTATTYTDTGVVAGVPHSYRVQAIRNAALGEKTNQIKIFPVQKATNSPATGAPAISGTAQVGETLTADISGIADEDGLENVTKDYLWAAIGSSGKIGAKYAYQWLADGADSRSGDHHAGYNNTTYTLTEDEVGKAISVRVTFVDDAGYQETLTSAATDAVAPLPQPNSPARGAPTIGGTAQVGETLTADTSGITDEDGLDDSTFTVQWITEDSVMVASAARSYSPTDGDRGKSVKVRVSFTDDAGNPETRSSAQTAAVAARSNSAGICDRTERVRDNIISLLNAQDLGSLGIKDCSEVTDEYLSRIRFLDLAGGGTGGKITSLKSGDFEGLSGMSELNLEDNSLSNLPEGVFDGLSSLELLTMQGNGLSSLPDGVFDDLTNLHTLGLYDNNLAELPDGVFDQLTKLTRLAISNNKLTSLPDGVFAGMSKLQTVNFSGNPSAPFTLTAELERQGDEGVVVKVSEGAPFAMTVTLSAAGGTLSNTSVTVPAGGLHSETVTVTPDGDGVVTVSVESAAFPDTGIYSEGIRAGVGESLTLEAAASGICDRTPQVRDAILGMLPDTSDCALVTDMDLGGITRLWLSEKGITTLKSGDFSGLSNLQWLILDNNELSALPEDIFDNLTGLQRLHLYNNELSRLPDGVFDDLTGLEMLLFGNNRLTELPDGIFDNLTSLIDLTLIGNELNELPDGIFDNLVELRDLRLWYNLLSELPGGAFDNLVELQYLSLDRNSLSELPDGIFDNTNRLQWLYLSENKLSELPVGIFDNLAGLEKLKLGRNELSELPNGIFDKLTWLEELSLSANELSELPDGALDNLASLKWLYLGGNQLGELPNGVFDKLTRLQSLGLSSNRLSELPDGIFDELTSLEWIGITRNELSELPDGVFDNVPELWWLDLKYNQLSALPEGIFGNLTGLRELHLFSNNLSELPDDTFLGLTNLYAMDFRLNTGSPFILTAELEQTGKNTIALKVAQGTPVDMEVTLAAEGGALSSTVVAIAAGSVSSGPVTVHPDGGEPVTISVVSANIPRPTNNRIIGIQTGLGDPLTVEQVSITNTPAIGAPTISGTAQVGETLRTDTSDIEDANGLANATFSYRWVSSDGTTDTDIEKATGSTYTLVATDHGKFVKVRVTFTDDGGNEETLTSAPTAPVWGDGPPGAPRNLTATPGNKEITLSWELPADNGNAPATRYRIEWRIDGKDYDQNHWGTARSTTYTTNDQANLANGVKYFFRVKAGNGSGNSYGPYGPASGEVSATPTSGSAVDLATPVLSDTETLHHGMVRLDWEDVEDAGWYVVQYYHVKGGEWLDLPAAGVDIAFHGSSAVVSNLHGLSWLRVGAASCDGASEWSQIEELYGTEESDWEGVPVPEVAEGDEIEPCPVVLGTSVLSEPEYLHHGMVQLDWPDIEDAGWYVVQYYHVKGGEWLDLPAVGVDIAFHGSSAVVSNLHGLSWLRVRAMSCAGASEWSQIEQLFGTKESDWEGVPVPEVAEGDEIAPCSENADTPDNRPATGAPTISGTAQVGETLEVDTSAVADADGLTNVSFTYQWLADDADINGATGSTYTLTDSEEGKAIKVEVSFIDDAGNAETLTSEATVVVTAKSNSPATGVPTISGAAQVGETLTANPSSIADADGLSKAQYEYQWLADDSEIAGATNATYTLATLDEGKAIKVQVSFTDDAGNAETLTSAATDAVAAAEPSEPPDKPTGLDAAATHDSVTLTWDDPGDDSITGYVILRRVRVNDQGGDFSVLVANTETAATTYTDDTVAASTTYTYRIKAINEHGTSERSRWVHIDTPAPPVPDQPTGLDATATHDSVSLIWDDPGDDSITGYVILRRLPGVDPKGQFDELVADTGTAATTYTDGSVAAETRYTYRIKAINEHGTSERSRWYHIDTPAPPDSSG